MGRHSRRVFLQQVGATAAVAALPKFARADVNSQIRVAVVGFNGRGQSHIDGFTDQLVALRRRRTARTSSTASSSASSSSTGAGVGRRSPPR